MQLKPEINQNKILIDFENAFVKAAQDIFPDTIISGCNFHFNQCIHRSVQDNGLADLYNDDISYSAPIRMLLALVFVPCRNVEFAFDFLWNSQFFVTNANELDSILDYFQRTWLGPKGIRGR